MKAQNTTFTTYKSGVFMKKSIFTVILALFASLFLAGCYEPSPLYGTWADNNGNKITFINDGTFVAKILDSKDQSVNYEGSYNVIDNVIVFSYSYSDGEETVSGSMNTEWDIRGSMLYCTWTVSDYTRVLTLYHTSK